jgi:hypothetical protein
VFWGFAYRQKESFIYLLIGVYPTDSDISFPAINIECCVASYYKVLHYEIILIIEIKVRLDQVRFRYGRLVDICLGVKIGQASYVEVGLGYRLPTTDSSKVRFKEQYILVL